MTPAQLAGFKALYMDGTQFRPIDRRIQGDMVLMHFPGWDDMTAAETLKTKILSIKRSEVQLKKGEFLDAELIGMQVYEDFIHRYVGTVEEVLTYPAHKLYKVRGPEKCYLIPAVQDIFIVDIDAEKREIYVKMIEGLETNDGAFDDPDAEDFADIQSLIGVRIDILTLFPDAVDAMMHASILGRAQERGYITIRTTRSAASPRISRCRWTIIPTAADAVR